MECLHVRRSVLKAEPESGPADQGAVLCGGAAPDGWRGGIASTGVLGDHHCRALGWDDLPIAGLYVAGNSMARTDNGAVMQSGITNARGMTHG
jgi:3-oxosteroid 1-dehydrogenase